MHPLRLLAESLYHVIDNYSRMYTTVSNATTMLGYIAWRLVYPAGVDTTVFPQLYQQDGNLSDAIGSGMLRCSRQIVILLNSNR